MPIELDESGKFKAYEPTDRLRAEVSALKSFGHTHEEIAEYLGIDDETLVKYYKLELNMAIIKANANVANKLYKKAVDQEDLAAIIFWLKTRGQGKWREKDKEENNLQSVVEKLIDKLK